ncbi:DUF2062 domain-containing protein [Rhodobacter calidifons]|uniref:DUF2062 domain-containing protein n=1 Tax=Rhodobacter calidifons TaxID=2715277 RepID=A0ABX0G5C1_9RHOB|nr:DUF2062 domain-containing protein [Rhodobacter calidifons]NHB76433.1 DUF2062 domain-containing protein [Rhodobacter calidifons]
MVFRRRTPLNLMQKLRALVLPKGGWGRAFRYLRHRASRIPDAPHRIARGIACGVFASFTPLFGLHFFLAAFLAWIVRGNVIAALIGTAAGNPLTFPFIAVLSIDLGHTILGSRADGVPVSQIMTAFGQAGDEIFRNIRAIFGAEEMRWDRLERFFRGVFLPYLVGGLGPGLVAAVVSYWLSLPALNGYQKLRAARREARARKLAEKPAPSKEENRT